MSETISHDDFLKVLGESGVLSGSDARAALDGLAGPGVPADPAAVARGLVEAGRLTPYQAEAILAGRVPDLFIGNYAILRRLGAGGMGTVFQARHRSMKRVVALKTIPRDAPTEGDHARRFQREVETIAQLSHPNIVMAHDAGESGDVLFLVMEYVEGRDLAAEVGRNGPLSTAGAVDCVLQAARGLSYAHGHGIVHRDVKPANLLRADAGVVKVADLGLAHLSNPALTGEGASLTLAGSVLGTADYIAPEQALDSSDVDHRADIYSLGGTLYFLLAGRPMYSAQSLMALLLRHRDAPAPSLVGARPDAPAELEAVYRRMVAKDPGDRYPTMAGVVEDLERLKASAVLSPDRPDPGPLLEGSPSSTDVTAVIGPGGLGSAGFVGGGGDSAAPVGSSGSSVVRRVSDLAVVVVESSGLQAKVALGHFSALGVENVVAAATGREALERAGRGGADVVFSAMYLPDMTGAELAGALRQDPGCAGVGFVLASSDGGEPVQALESPRSVFLPKPFDLRQLAGALARATGRVVEEILG